MSAPPDATTDPLGVWRLAWPTMTLFALHALVGIVDLAFVSSLGADAVAAVGVSAQIHFFSFSLLQAVTVGTTAVVAREWGRGERDEAARATRCSVALAAVLGGGMALAAPFATEIVSVLGVQAGVAALGGSCLAVLLAFSLPFSFEATLSQALRAAGDVRTPLWIGVVANVVNVFADWVLIFGHLGAPELGAVGSAWASALAFTVAAGMLWVPWARGRLRIPSGRWRGSVERRMAGRLLRVGLPAAAEHATFQGGLLIFMRIITGFGTPAIAAYLIGIRILAFCFVPGMGYSMATSTLVGQNLGADRPELAERAGWRGMRAAVAVMGSVGFAIALGARPLATFFGAAGGETMDLAVVFIVILAAAQPLMAMEFTLGGGLRGAGDTRFPLLVILTGLFVVRLGGALLVARPLFGTVTAVWLCLIADWGTKAALLAWRFRRGRWKQIEV